MIVLVTVSAVLIVFGGLTALHLGLISTASLFYRAPSPGPVEPMLFLVVIPAYNEELLLGETLAAAQLAMRDRDRILVVDDRSTDATADIAEAAGADVLRRDPASEPGRAAARRAGIEWSKQHEWDAMVMIDADSLVAPDFFDRSEEAMTGGVRAAQARSEAAHGTRLLDQVALASFAVQGVALPRGREVLGLPVRLRGTGMVLRREVVEQLDFRAKASEDLQVSLDLLRAGVRTRHIERATLRSANAGSWKVASTQKQRYEAGRMSAAREYVPRLLALRSWPGFESAWFLASPPFAVAAALLVLGTIGAAVASSWWLAVVGLVGIGLLAWTFTVACVQARVGFRVILGLLLAPGYLAWKLAVQLRALLGLRGGLKEFGATPRS